MRGIGDRPERSLMLLAMIVLLASSGSPAAPAAYVLREYSVPEGSHPHDVAPAADGGVWYTAQTAGTLGYLNPFSGQTRQLKLGDRSAPTA